MAQEAYGKTWWGVQWLNALSQIDYDNRLPRGRSYANKGAVAKIEIRRGKIHAKVKGSRPRPYNVSIEVPAMPQQQVVTLLDALVSNPVIISKMLNRELDPMILEQAERLKISIFPKRWQDLDMDCSCPDWAVPCKHLAAVVYLISREIDGNPFVIFSLKSVDLVAELKARHISIEREAKASLPPVADLLDPSRQPVAMLPNTDVQADYRALDYTALPELTMTLASVLPANPAFYQHGDFRLIYEKAMKQVARRAHQALKATQYMDETLSTAVIPADKPRIVLNDAYQPDLTGITTQTNWQNWLASLSLLTEANLPDLQPEVMAMYHARMASLQLLAQGAVLPQIFDAGKSVAGLRWLPAMLDEMVAAFALIDRLAALLPTGLVAVNSGQKAIPLHGRVQALTLCSLFLHGFIRDWQVTGTGKMRDDKLLDLFFGQGYADFDSPGEREVATGVQQWLSRLYIDQQTHVPVLHLEENGMEFDLSLGVVACDTVLQEPTPFADLLTNQAWQENRYRVLQTVALLAEFFPALNSYIGTGATTPITLSADALPVFLHDTLPVIRLLGIRVLLPKALDRILRPRLSMKVSGKDTGDVSFFNTDDLLRFDWTVAIGNHHLTKAEFESLVETAHGIVRFKGEYVYLDTAEIEQLRLQLQKPANATPAELLRIALAEEYLGTPVTLDDKAQSIIQALTQIENMPLPAELNATLRPYQERGYAWLYRNIHAGFGSVIADDMGLGKTLQVIVTLLKLKEEGELSEAKALVVVPTSLLTNWSKEIARFAPTLTAGIFHGARREQEKERPDILLTTYGTVRTDLAKFKKQPWRIVIIDEAQNIKNPATAQTKAVKAIPASTSAIPAHTQTQGK